MIAFTGGGTSTWFMWKYIFSMFSFTTFCISEAVIGVVVSKPIAKYITFLSGFSFAIFNISNGA